MRTITAIMTMLLLGACGDEPADSRVTPIAAMFSAPARASGGTCMAPGETGIVTRVTEQKQRGWSAWHVAFRDAKGITRVCRGPDGVQALQPGDKIDGTGLWR